jgi:two-component system alkaline phosphatase synthesis response regulator PhoP
LCRSDHFSEGAPAVNESASALKAPEFMARILCVDDEPHVVTLKCAILESAGHTVTASTSARDAMEKLQSNTYDAVVTDWRLGDANGRAVVQAAKNNSSMPVVVVSGYVAEAFQAAEPLADLYLEKPVNPEELVTIVNELLKSSERATSH